jgi:hypothetical protein
MSDELTKYDEIENKLFDLIESNNKNIFSYFKREKVKLLIYQYQLELYRIDPKRFFSENRDGIKYIIDFIRHRLDSGKRYYETGIFTSEPIRDTLARFRKKLKRSERILNMIGE